MLLAEPGLVLTLGIAWVQLTPWLPKRPTARMSGVPPSIVPTQVWEDGEQGSGVQRENLVPSGILEKLIPKETQPWLCYY